MSTTPAPAALLSDSFGDTLTDAVLDLARMYEQGEIPAVEAVAIFLGLSDACVAWFCDAKGCDGCDLRLSGEACDYAGLDFATDREGDVQVCPFCREESREPMDPQY